MEDKYGGVVLMTKVVKFGGSSLASAEQFKKVADIIGSDSNRRYVIPSAPGKRYPSDIKVTDMFYDCYETALSGKAYDEKMKRIEARYKDIINELELNISLDGYFDEIKKAFDEKSGEDYAASRGEYLNGIILANYLNMEFIDAAEVIYFDEYGGYDEQKTTKAMLERFNGIERAVIPGFYGLTAQGNIKTFSRGGSDITGSIVASVIKADLYENWTDVSGFLVADPRIIKNPEVIPVITYKELRELSYMGATVLHEDAIFPVRKAGIPINIRNTNLPEDAGTMIVECTSQKAKYTITGIAGKTGFTVINIEKDKMNSELGFGRKVLEVLEKNKISFEHMPSGIDTMSIVVQQADFQPCEQKILSRLHKEVSPDTIEIETNLALLAVVGRTMKSTRGVSGRIFSALAHNNINVKMIDQGSSELNIIIGIHEKDYVQATKAIYDIFVETEL